MERGRGLTLKIFKRLQERVGNIENSNQAKPGPNAIQGKKERRYFRGDSIGHTQDDKKCPSRNKECIKCRKVDHFAKCCETKKTKSPQKKRPSKPKGRKGTVNHMNFEDYSDVENEFVFTIVDEKEPIVLVSIGGVHNVS